MNSRVLKNKDIIKKYKNDKFLKTSFYIISILFILIFFSSLVLSHGETLKKYLFHNITDTFMDFFNSMYDTVGRHPYQNGVIYPPLCYVIYLLLLRIAPVSQLANGSPVYKTLQGPTVSFFVYFIIVIISLAFIIKKVKKGNEFEKNIFLLITLFSLPFMFAFERGNIIILSLIFLMVFIYYKDSNNKILRELSLISLAISAAIKIYPAIFGLLLLREKRYKELFRAAFYTILLVLLPFLLFGGFKMIIQFIHNLQSTTDSFESSPVNKLNIMAAVKLFIIKYNLNSITIQIIVKAVSVFVILLSLLNIMKSNSNWKRLCLLSLLMIEIPGISFTYTAIFMVLPLIAFLDEEKSHNILNYIYLLLFILIMMPNPIALLEHGDVIHFASEMSLSTKIMSSSLFALMLIVNFDITFSKLKNK